MSRIAHISDSEADDSSESGEEHPQAEQPQTYPENKPQVLPQFPPATSESTEVYVMVEEENLSEGKNWSTQIIYTVASTVLYACSTERCCRSVTCS